MYACECFNTSCGEVSQLCAYWKVFKVSTDEAVHFIETSIGLCALDSVISGEKIVM